MFGGYKDQSHNYATLSNSGNQTILGVWSNGRPNFNGTISSLNPCKGVMTFPDDREYNFEFDPSSSTLYWDSRNSGNKWTKLSEPMSVCKAMFGKYKDQSDNDVTLSNSGNHRGNQTILGVWSNGRPNFNGTISSLNPCKGVMTFPDDREYNFEFDHSSYTLYWDGRNSGNMWTKLIDMFGRYKDQSVNYATLSNSGNQTILGVWSNDRPNFNGTILSLNPCKGVMTFPDDREYNFEFDPSSSTLYWDSRNSGNKWTKLSVLATNMSTYLNFMANWEDQSDAEVQKLIDEQRLFKQLDDFKSDSAIDDEFKTLVDLATEVRDETIAADAVQLAADAAAVAAFWSFGLSMIAFAALEATEITLKAVISSKSKELNAKLKTVDTDIASKINNKVYDYIEKYKANNDVIKSIDPKETSLHDARSYLMQFMAEVDRKYKGKGGLSVNNFKQLAHSARLAYSSQEINKVYDALNKLNLSNKTKDDVQSFVDTLKGLDFGHRDILTLVQGISLGIAAYKMNIARNTIKECAQAAELPLEEVESSAFGMMDALGKFAAGVAIVMAVVDVVLSILDIVDIVEQTKKLVDELNDTIKPNYKKFFNGIKESAKAYNKAISETKTK